MAEIIGRDVEAGVSVEDTRGTAAPSIERAVKKVSAEVLPQAEHVVDDATRGQYADSENRRVVQKWIEGDLEAPVEIGALGYYLYNLYGTVSTSEIDTSGVYEHVWTLQQDNKHPSLTVFVKNGDIAEYSYSGAMLTGLEINVAPDDLVRATRSFVARESSTFTGTYTYPTDYDFIGKDVSVKIADTSSGLGAANAQQAKDLTINWDPNAITDEFVFGQYTPKDLYNAGMGIEVSLTKQYEDETWRDLFQNDTSKYLRIIIEGSTDIGGGNHAKFQLTLNKAMVTDWSRSGDSDDIVNEEITVKGLFNTSDSKQSEIITQSSISEYDTAPTS